MLQENTKVRFTGLGTFKTTHVKKRQARNPQTGESVMVPAKERLKFTPMNSFKKRLNPES